MSHNRQAERILKGIVFATLMLVAAMQIAACRGLYADGANVLISILKNGGFFLFEKHRLTFSLLTQAPTALAIQADLTDLPFLHTLYAGTLVALPLLFWGLTLYEVRKDFLFWPFLMLFCFVYYNTGFMAVSELSFCFALTACCLAGLLRPGPYGPLSCAVLLCAAILYPLEYAATLFLGPILAALAFLKFYREQDRKWQAYWLVLAILFLASVGTGLQEVVNPRDPSNFASARDPQMLMSDGLFWILLVYGGVTGLSLFMRSMGQAAAALLLCVALLMILFFELSVWDPFFSYGIRMYMTLMFIPCCLAMIGLDWYGRRRIFKSATTNNPSLTLRYGMPVFVLFMALSLFDMDLSYRYRTYIEHFAAEVDSKSGLIPFEQTDLQYDSGERLFFRPWTHPAMSVVLRSGADRAIILNPAWYNGYQGVFDPQEQIPDLSRYYINAR